MKKSKKSSKSEVVSEEVEVSAETTPKEVDTPTLDEAKVASKEAETNSETIETPSETETAPKETEATPEVATTPEQPPKAKHKKLLVFLIVLGLVFFVGGGAFLIYALQTDFRTGSFQANRTVDYKSEYRDDYGDIRYCNLFQCEDVEVTSEGTVDTSTIGDYKVTYTIKHQDRQITLEQTVSVRDISVPNIETEAANASRCADGKIPTIKYTITDAFDGDLTDKGQVEQQDGKIAIKVTDAAGNQATKLLDIVDDATPPVITLNGKAEMQTRYGLPYYDPGATATDDCDDKVAVETDNKVNPNAEGDYEVVYTATDKAGNQATAKRTVKVVKASPVQPENKVIYLTFDDGPSEHTFRLLDILKKYNVKATFFVTGNQPDDAILREWQEGHSIGLHTYTHAYSVVYQSDERFMSDLYAIQERVKNITGFTSTLMRFPGGSSNTVSRNYSRGIMSRLTRTVTERGFTYFDWNVSSGDAGGATSSDAVYNNVVNSLKSGRSIVLQHDTKGFSVDAVERIINYGLENGYTFDRLEPGYWGAHHGINN